MIKLLAVFAFIMCFLWFMMTFYRFKLERGAKLNKKSSVYFSGYFLLEQCQLEQKAATLIQHLHMNYMLLEQVGWNYTQTKHKVAEKLGEFCIVLVGGSILTAVTSEAILLVVTIVAASAILIHLYQGTTQKVRQRKQQIILELPIILTKMTLLIEAGETIASAFVRCMRDHTTSTHPLHKEWLLAITMLQNGETFPQVIEKFTKRCSVQVISVLSTYLLLNYARGGAHFVTSIQDLVSELWEQRKTIARKKGEEASSKLIFPTIVILLLLMILIVMPALSLIQII